MNGTFLIGADIGTTGCKVMLFDIDGNLIQRYFREWITLTPKAIWAEQKPEVWWIKLSAVLRKITKKVDAKQIAGIAVSGLGPTVIPINKHGRVLRRAIIWMDQRSKYEAEFLSSKTGIQIIPSSKEAKVLWIKNNEPKIFQKTYKFIGSYEYINFKLTDEIKTTVLRASDKENYERYLNSMKFPLNKFPDPVFIGSICGEVTPGAAKETGLTKGTIVVSASFDSYSSILGSGANEPGIACDIGGTSQIFSVCSENEVAQDLKRGIGCFPHLVSGLWHVAGNMSSTGISLKWFRDNLVYPQKDKLEISAPTLFYILNIEVEKTDPGSKGLIFLPYMMGKRAPIPNPDARGVFFGLNLNHKRAHLIRAIMEGVAYEIRQISDIIEKLGPKILEIRATGGQAKSRVWRQIKADVLNKPITKLSIIDSEPVGSAILAGLGSGVFNDVSEATMKMIHVVDRIEPRPKFHKRYTKLYEIYKNVYLDLETNFKNLINVF